MKQLTILLTIGLLTLGLTACEPEEQTTTTTKQQSVQGTAPTTKPKPKADPTSCQEAVEIDNQMLSVTAEVLGDIFNKEKTDLATTYIESVTPERSTKIQQCVTESVSDKQGAPSLQPCIDVLLIDDVLFMKVGDALQDVFDTQKMGDLKTHVQSVTPERLEKKQQCEDL